MTAAPAGAPREASAKPLLEVRDLRTRIGSRHGSLDAVDGIDLVVHEGEAVALVGESGSGKTMTARSIMRLLPPGAVVGGSIFLDGVDLLRLNEREMNDVRGAQIALLFQQPLAALDPTSKVGAQVAEPLRVHRGVRRGPAWRRSAALLADVGIPEPERRLHTYAHQLSGGMAQRVMIAAALSGEPRLLIADEPTTSLDVTVQAQILKLLVRKRVENGLSMLLITHDLAIVQAVADRVAVMYAGQIVEEAPVRELFARPRHPYTRALLQASLLAPEQGGRLFTIRGAGAGRARSAAGCRFCDRCALADELHIRSRCTAEAPELVAVGPGRRSRCFAAGADGD